MKSVLLGVVLALATIGLSRLLSITQTRRLFAVLLGAAAGIYVGDALSTGGTSLAVQIAAFTAFVILAILKSPWVLGAAWILHGGWDLLHLLEAIPTLLPVYYQVACLAADLVWGAFLLRLSAQSV